MTFWYVLHPCADGRWRWAIHMKQPTPVTPLDGSLNAGSADTRQAADLEGQTVLYTLLTFCTRVLRMARPTTVPVEWDLDPFAGRSLHAVDTPDGPTVIPV
jgi:hypothetical protein